MVDLLSHIGTAIGVIFTAIIYYGLLSLPLQILLWCIIFILRKLRTPKHENTSIAHTFHFAIIVMCCGLFGLWVGMISMNIMFDEVFVNKIGVNKAGELLNLAPWTTMMLGVCLGIKLDQWICNTQN